MKLLTHSIREQLLRNGRTRAALEASGEGEADFPPVVKLFTPDAQCAWLLSEIDPLNSDLAFGLCDLGMGSPELGSVCLSDLQALRGALGLPVERDRHFTPTHRLSVYARAAWHAAAITDNPAALALAAEEVSG
ncbi:MAG: DUF2958 domain-containing protein [Pseudomonadales bacterium]